METGDKSADAVPLFKGPTALIVGRGAVAPVFGKRFDGVRPASQTRRFITVTSGARQLDLYHPHVVAITSERDMYKALATVMGNRVWRMFMACHAAADEDFEKGRVHGHGGFLYTPTRFADLLGYAREDDGDGRQPFRSYAKVDALLDGLGKIAVEAGIRRGNRTISFKVDHLVGRDGWTIEELRHGGTRPGTSGKRRSAVAFRINDAVMGQLAKYYTPLPRNALCPPGGVDVRTWDDGFKVLTLVSAWARVEAENARSNVDLPWRCKLSTLIDCANVAGPGVPLRHTNERVRGMLTTLATAGYLHHQLEVDDNGVEWLLYGLPSSQRDELRRIGGRNAVLRVRARP